MHITLARTTAVALFGYFRQAERSIDYALSSPKQWALFSAYYDERKRARIADLVKTLTAASPVPDQGIERLDFVEPVLVSVLRAAGGLLFNRLRASWSFAGREISFFSATLDRLLSILCSPEMPAKDCLIDLRMDFFECQEIVRRKLVGVPELRTAAAIEHFSQSELVERVTFEDMGIQTL